MTHVLRQLVAVTLAGLAFAAVSFASDPPSALARGIPIIGKACVPDDVDQWLPSWCNTKASIDACSGTTVLLSRFEYRKCAWGWGICKPINPGTVNVLQYETNCVWSASGCVINATGNVVSWSPLAGYTVSGRTCSGTMKGKDPDLPKVCEGCVY